MKNKKNTGSKPSQDFSATKRQRALRNMQRNGMSLEAAEKMLDNPQDGGAKFRIHQGSTTFYGEFKDAQVGTLDETQSGYARRMAQLEKAKK